jgi:hypothetical protein
MEMQQVKAAATAAAAAAEGAVSMVPATWVSNAAAALQQPQNGLSKVKILTSGVAAPKVLCEYDE